MSYKKYTRKKREKTLQQIAFATKKKHEKSMQGKRTILVPHPTIPNTMIEKIIEDDSTL